MVILNTNESSWIIGISPMIRVGYTATLLSNGVIVYIGGYELDDFGGYREAGIKEINLYDTNSSTWSNKVCMNVIYPY